MSKTIFLSHNKADKSFVRRVAQDLKRFSIKVWIDEAEIQVGDSLIDKISNGIESYDYLGVFLSNNSVNSEWVKREVNIALHEEINGRKIKVLPFLIEDCQIPTFLRDKLYVDFSSTNNYNSALSSVLERLEAGLYEGEINAPTLEPIYSNSLGLSNSGTACFCPITDRLLIADNNTLIVVGARNGETISTIQSNLSDFSCLAFSADCNTMFGGDFEGNIVRWNDNEEKLFSAKFSDQYTAIIKDIFPVNNVALSLGLMGNPDFHLWSLNDGTHVGQLECQGFYPNTYDLLDSKLVAGSMDGHIRIWNIKSYAPNIMHYKGHNSSVNAICILPKTNEALSGDGNGTLIKWDLNNQREVKRIEPKNDSPDGSFFDGITKIHTSINGKYVAIICDDLKILETSSLRCLAKIPIPYYSALTFSSNEKELILFTNNKIMGYKIPKDK